MYSAGEAERMPLPCRATTASPAHHMRRQNRCRPIADSYRGHHSMPRSTSNPSLGVDITGRTGSSKHSVFPVVSDDHAHEGQFGRTLRLVGRFSGNRKRSCQIGEKVHTSADSS